MAAINRANHACIRLNPYGVQTMKQSYASAGKACMGLVWGFLCQGSITPFLSSFVIPFFCLTRAASILPSRLHISIAVARSGGQGRCFFSSAEGLSLTDVSTAAGSLAIGWLAAR